MNITVSIHIFPTELGRYARLIDKLNEAYVYAGLDDNTIYTHVTLNLNDSLVNWETSKFNKSEIIYEFDKINNTLLSHNNICEPTTDKKFLGVNEHRRQSIQRYSTTDSIVFLDTDIHFRKQILKHQIDAYNMIDPNSWFIISPQTVRLWDDTWDCIVNEKYIKKQTGYHLRVVPTDIVSTEHGDVFLKPIDTFKWGGGWFNSISPKLLSKIGIPNSFPGYGPDDTYIMVCADILKRRGYNVQQYVLQNELIVEEHTKDQTDPYNKIPMEDVATELRKSSERNFQVEVKNFLSKL
jgi:hypothetical protein